METYLLPSNPNTRGHIVATSDDPAYGMHPASTPTQPTVPDELSTAEQTTTAIYEDIPQYSIKLYCYKQPVLAYFKLLSTLVSNLLH